MSSSSVEKIKERLSISDVLGTYIKLEKAGANYKARCPFHNEKTPSFFLSSSRNTYYCFGCGAKGDIFTFVQEFEGLDFVGSLHLLAERAGVEIEKFEPKNKEEKDQLFDVLQMASNFYEKNLAQNTKALDYLHERGLSDETIKEWHLGYASNEWRSVSTYLLNQNVPKARIENVGLIKKGVRETQDGFYDVFRGRILFPISDTSGRIIAFSGRIFDDAPDAPKYLNSPETALFIKSETLYGLHKAKIGIRKKDYSILVEGQMDLLMCHQAGFDNTVASSGTAFTEAHLLKLKRLSNRILFIFDGDGAGFQASLKSGNLALSLGMEVKFVELPKGEDPADIISKNVEQFRDAVKNSKHIIDFYLDKLLAENFVGLTLAKEIEKRVLPYVAKLQSSIEQSHFVSQISKKSGIKEDAIWNDLRKIGHQSTVSNTAGEFEKKESIQRKNHLERRLIGILLWQESEKEPQISTDKIRVQMTGLLGDAYMVELLREQKPYYEELIFEAESYYGGSLKLEKEIEELLMALSEDILRERFVVKMRELDEAEKKKDEVRTKDLLAECQQITVKLAEISEKRRAT